MKAASILLLALGIASLPVSALAATFTVANTDDSGAGSLREAIADAAAAAGADLINFDASLSGTTIALTSGEMAIDAAEVLDIDTSALAAGVTVTGR